MPATESQLVVIADAFRHHGGVAVEIAGSLSPEQFTWAPPGRWSVGECLDHLNEIAALYLMALEPLVERARSAGRTGAGPFRAGWLMDRLIGWMEPPPRLRMTTPHKPDRVARRLDRGEVLRTFAELRGRYLDLLSRMDGLDLGAIKVASPINGLLRMNAYAALLFLLAHERRHLWQARGVTRDDGFPPP